MKAITVKYLPQTEKKPARLKAVAAGGHSLTVSYNSEEDNGNAFTPLAKALADKLEWHGTWAGGTLPNGDIVYVLVDDRDTFQVKFHDEDYV